MRLYQSISYSYCSRRRIYVIAYISVNQYIARLFLYSFDSSSFISCIITTVIYYNYHIQSYIIYITITILKGRIHVRHSCWWWPDTATIGAMCVQHQELHVHSRFVLPVLQWRNQGERTRRAPSLWNPVNNNIVFCFLLAGRNRKRKIWLIISTDDVLPDYPIFVPNSGLVPICALIPQRLFSEITGKTLLGLGKLKMFLG